MPEANKTEQATPRRRQQAREQGQVVRSRDLVASLATLGAVLAVASQAPAFVGEWRALLRRDLDAAVARDPRGDELMDAGPGNSDGKNGAWGNGERRNNDLKNDAPLLAGTSLAVLQGAGVVLGLSWTAALLGALAQGGLVVAPAALQPKLSRLSPAARLEQMFSLSSVGRLLKSLLPGAAVIAITGTVLSRDWPLLLTLPRLAIVGLASFSLGRVFEIAWKSALVLLAWSGADYLIEKHKLEGDLRMSKQDLRDEHKELEGHPSVKARIRRLQRQLRRRRMLEEVKHAAVVITNPTEFAVALQYNPELPAPVVVAKGLNLFAQQIKQTARWQGIPVVENPPLAHALYRAVEVGQSIPPKLYAVVAGILAAIYRAEEQARARSPQAASGGR